MRSTLWLSLQQRAQLPHLLLPIRWTRSRKTGRWVLSQWQQKSAPLSEFATVRQPGHRVQRREVPSHQERPAWTWFYQQRVAFGAVHHRRHHSLGQFRFRPGRLERQHGPVSYRRSITGRQRWEQKLTYWRRKLLLLNSIFCCVQWPNCCKSVPKPSPRRLFPRQSLLEAKWSSVTTGKPITSLFSNTTRADTFFPCSVNEACSTRDAMAKGLYSRLFDWIVNQINRHLSFGRLI